MFMVTVTSVWMKTKGAKMELVKIAIVVTSSLIPVLCVANYFLARANRII